MEIVTERALAAPPDRVWAALADLAAYPEWNPFTPVVEGELAAVNDALAARVEAS